MKTPICDQLGIDLPIFGFSHCRDVVAAVSRAGGFGVLGAASYSAEQLELEMKWIDEHSDGRPYGLDVVMPAGYVPPSSEDDQIGAYIRAIPERHWKFVDQVLTDLAVPPLPANVPKPELKPGWNAQTAREHIEVGFRHPIRMLVNALGSPPTDVVSSAHELRILVGALAGKPEHAERHVQAGVDVIIGTGSEAAGHTGDIGTVALIPDLVEAVGPDVPVLAAGGIASGYQLAAALALGAQGVWIGSLWLTTVESDVDPAIKKRYIAAGAADTVRTRENSGKPSRGLRTPWRDAWLSERSPGTLPMPLQGILTTEAKERIKHAHRDDLAHASVGQAVGRMKSERRVRDVVISLVEEYADAITRLNKIADAD
jgi:NAD(P)H-dependent flavin oxidoreductase YrpB (nitropropane dioxygenase family)